MATFELVQGDCVRWLNTLEAGTVNLAVMDPAYESLEKHRAKGTTTRLVTDWFDIFPNVRFPELLAELYRVLADDSHLYVLCDQETAFLLKPMGEAAGFTFWKPLVWDKVTIGMGYHYRARYELILFFEKGKRRLNNLGTPDVLTVPRVRGYPTEKPEELLATLISQSSEPGELVIDPFMGSGSTGAAALRLGRHFAGCDVAARAIELTHERLTKLGVPGYLTTAKRQGALF